MSELQELHMQWAFFGMFIAISEAPGYDWLNWDANHYAQWYRVGYYYMQEIQRASSIHG